MLASSYSDGAILTCSGVNTSGSPPVYPFSSIAAKPSSGSFLSCGEGLRKTCHLVAAIPNLTPSTSPQIVAN